MTINIGLCGATGKMGQTIIERIGKFNDCKISEKFNSSNNLNNLDHFCKNSDVIIDFSTPELLEKLIDSALKHKTKLVIGTTDLKPQHFDYIKTAAQTLPILYSANMSLGANLLGALAKIAAKTLDNSYDVEILDTHHRAKKDAPSGTAILLGEIIAAAKGLNFDECAAFNRSDSGSRKNNEIGISSIRGGNIHGIHDIYFLSDDETITLQHQALNKNSFADGAIKAAIWLADKPPGLYSMLDVFENLSLKMTS
ncbi:4-hydroxy-tetrahydrodipicolinate reductase [Rickettsia endosymbiont of Polydrusus tereticollis]|uniref:4-hydroxy-tetrahydrodipicolinate reductase n=1 Tax=Rickettsia endosymbiont of Polydrusus tereticollis TaxID=3066251 RepID=UPI00313332A4